KLRRTDLLSLYYFQLPHLPQQIADLLKIRRVTVTLADRPLVVLPGQVQFVRALPDVDARDVVEREIRQQFLSRAPFAGGLIRGRIAPGDEEARSANDRAQDQENGKLFSVHFAAVLLRL